MKPIRILHCPTMVGGNPQGLARAERALGLESWAVAFEKSGFAYESDEVLFNGRGNYLQKELLRWKFLRRAINDFDIIHFNFGRSIMPHRATPAALKKRFSNPLARSLYAAYSTIFEYRDLSWLKRAGKKIFVTYQGNDARQMDYCREHFEITFAKELDVSNYSPAIDSLKRAQIKRMARFADRIFALNPDLLQVLPPNASFMPYAQISFQGLDPARESREVPLVPVVVHAPTDKVIKGTRFIEAAVARLKAEGVRFEFILIEGKSYEETKEILARADLLVDQLLAGWYGGVAVECMALGKPVLCYIRKSDLQAIPREMELALPIIQATPSSIYEVLKEWLTFRKEELSHAGRRSFEYARRWHDPLAIAGKLKNEYEAVLFSG